MDVKTKNNLIKIGVVLTYLLMLGVNSLANILPINGQTTGGVSDAYPNLFAPAGVTFSIWGLIYLLLGAYTVYQLDVYKKNVGTKTEGLLKKVGILFIVSSVANAAWIFSWHYHQIPLSMILMALILICLILANREIKKVPLGDKEILFIALPFSIYFGWITVATIANMTTLLVSVGWDGFGLSEGTWTIILLIVGTLIGISTMFVHKDMPYGFVLVWAYLGIFLKHTDENIFAGEYPGIINTTLTCIGVFLVAEAYVLFTKKDKIFRRNEHHKYHR